MKLSGEKKKICGLDSSRNFIGPIIPGSTHPSADLILLSPIININRYLLIITYDIINLVLINKVKMGSGIYDRAMQVGILMETLCTWIVYTNRGVASEPENHQPKINRQANSRNVLFNNFGQSWKINLVGFCSIHRRHRNLNLLSKPSFKCIAPNSKILMCIK